MKKTLLVLFLAVVAMTAAAQKRAVFITAGQSNADGREYVSKLPSYLKSGKYNHLRFANVTSEAKTTFGDRNLLSGKRYAFQDITNYWIDQASAQDFYAIKCTFGGTAIALGQTAAKVPVWNASKEYLDTARAYRGQINGGSGSWPFVEGNSLAKSFSTGVASLIDGTLSRLTDGYEVKAIMWHQGESDRKAAGQYYDNLKTLIAYMRQSIYDKTGDDKALTTPFIMGTVCRNSTQYSSVVEDAQRKIAAEDPNVYIIDMSKASLRSDNLHFDSLSTEYLGKAMYNVLVKIGAVSGDTIETGLPYVKEKSQFADDDYADTRTWDFTQPWSDATVDSIKADAAHWIARSGWGYRYTNAMSKAAELQTATGYVFPETKGLYFQGVGNRACVNPGKNIGLYGGNLNLIVPQVKPGQYIIIESQSAKGERGLVPTTESKANLDSIQGGYKSAERLTNVWWVQDTFTDPVDASFTISGGGIYIYKVTVSESMNAVTGIADVQTRAQARTAGDHWYTLSGVGVAQPSGHGVFIRNGKKIVR